MSKPRNEQSKINLIVYEEQNQEIFNRLVAIKNEKNTTNMGALNFIIQENIELRKGKLLEEKIADATYNRFKKDMDAIRLKAQGADTTGYYNLFLLNNLAWYLLGEEEMQDLGKIYNPNATPHEILERATLLRQKMIEEMQQRKYENSGSDS